MDSVADFRWQRFFDSPPSESGLALQLCVTEFVEVMFCEFRRVIRNPEAWVKACSGGSPSSCKEPADHETALMPLGRVTSLLERPHT